MKEKAVQAGSNYEKANLKTLLSLCKPKNIAEPVEYKKRATRHAFMFAHSKMYLIVINRQRNALGLIVFDNAAFISYQNKCPDFTNGKKNHTLTKCYPLKFVYSKL